MNANHRKLPKYMSITNISLFYLLHMLIEKLKKGSSEAFKALVEQFSHDGNYYLLWFVNAADVMILHRKFSWKSTNPSAHSGPM